MEFYSRKERTGLLIFLCILLLIGGTLGTLLGLVAIIAGPSLVDTAYNTPQFAEFIKLIGLSGQGEQFIKETMKALFTILGMCLLLPGLLGLASGLCGLRGKGFFLGIITWSVGVILCILSCVTAFNLFSLACLIINVLFLYLWYRCKGCFD